MISALFAIYATVILIDEHNHARMHEYQLIRVVPESRPWSKQRWEPYLAFGSMAVCERYRKQLVAEWASHQNRDVPFEASAVVSSRCGPWEPDLDIAEPV